MPLGLFGVPQPFVVTADTNLSPPSSVDIRASQDDTVGVCRLVLAGSAGQNDTVNIAWIPWLGLTAAECLTFMPLRTAGPLLLALVRRLALMRLLAARLGPAAGRPGLGATRLGALSLQLSALQAYAWF